MRKIPCPTKAAGEAYDVCIERMLPVELRSRLAAARDDVVAAEAEYLASAAGAALHTFPRSRTIGGGTVTKDELTRVYTLRMARKSRPGRPVYDALVAGAPYGTCPLCGVGQVSTLDHHLPKSEYPVLAVTPINLVPACSWCQFWKKEAYPGTAEEQTIHPYFDDFTQQRWLYASVVEDRPAAFAFRVELPAGSNAVTAERLRHHIASFKLDLLFAANAANELVNIRFGLRELSAAGGASAVKAHVRQEGNSREAAFRNSWQTAMYRAAESSDWFCDGGFALL